jgi:hypothetical protein
VQYQQNQSKSHCDRRAMGASGAVASKAMTDIAFAFV